MPFDQYHETAARVSFLPRPDALNAWPHPSCISRM